MNFASHHRRAGRGFPDRQRGGAGAARRPRFRADRDGPALPQPVAEQLGAQPHLRAPGRPGRAPAPDAGARRIVEGDRRHHLGVQAAPQRQVPRRLAVHRRRRAVQLRARAERRGQPVELRHLHQGQDLHQGRRPHHPHQDRGALPADAERSCRPSTSSRRSTARARRRRTTTRARRRSAPARTASSSTRPATASSCSATSSTGARSRRGSA